MNYAFIISGAPPVLTGSVDLIQAIVDTDVLFQLSYKYEEILPFEWYYVKDVGSRDLVLRYNEGMKTICFQCVVWSHNLMYDIHLYLFCV